MRKILFYSLLFLIVFSSCKKEEENPCPKGCGGVSTHYAYVKGFVVDSVTGMPSLYSSVYCSNMPFSTVTNYSTSVEYDTVSGTYVWKMEWYIGNSLSAGTLSRPGDSTDLYINSYSANACNFLKFKWGQLVENDTILLPTIFEKPYAYMSTHIKEMPPVSSGVYLYLSPYPIVGGTTNTFYPANSDVIVTRKICPNLKSYVSWDSASDSVFVNSGDTAFVNVFY